MMCCDSSGKISSESRIEYGWQHSTEKVGRVVEVLKRLLAVAGSDTGVSGGHEVENMSLL